VFEFHGWARIRIRDPELTPAFRQEEEKVALEKVREAIQRADDQFSTFDVRVNGNELLTLSVHGRRNHRYGKVIELFQWIANELPETYGLLYTRDDELDGHENEFRVWRLARGRLEEMDDPFLSPCIPTFENGWNGQAGTKDTPS
jgi:hypothetical protein